MDLREILAISGQPGLYKFIAQSTHGVIVESLADQKRMNVASNARVSSMAEIAIFTEGDDMPIEKVFQEIFKATEGKQAINHKSAPEDLKKFFGKALPTYDKERVHVSDMKKVISWYNVLAEKGLIDLEEAKKEEENSNAE